MAVRRGAGNGSLMPDSSRTPDAAIEQRAFRDALGSFASSVTIVTTHDGVEPTGSTCQSFFSQSLEPPLVALSFRRESSSLPRFVTLGRFCVNVLSADQHLMSTRFARTGDRWSETRWVESTLGNPRLEGALAWFDCTVEALVPVGDHSILVGRVADFGARSDAAAEPLVFSRGQYRTLSSHRPADHRVTLSDVIDVDIDQLAWALLHS